MNDFLGDIATKAEDWNMRFLLVLFIVTLKYFTENLTNIDHVYLMHSGLHGVLTNVR